MAYLSEHPNHLTDLPVQIAFAHATHDIDIGEEIKVKDLDTDEVVYKGKALSAKRYDYPDGVPPEVIGLFSGELKDFEKAVNKAFPGNAEPEERSQVTLVTFIVAEKVKEMLD